MISEMAANVSSCRALEEYLWVLHTDEVSLLRSWLKAEAFVIFGWNHIEKLRTRVSGQHRQTTLAHRL